MLESIMSIHLIADFLKSKCVSSHLRVDLQIIIILYYFLL